MSLDHPPPGGSAGQPTLADFRPQPTDQTGTRVGDRYRIVGLLGMGATAAAYLVEDEATGAPLVVKSLHPHLQRDHQVRKRFVLGARAAMTVDHPAVARVFSVVEPDEDLPYIVMEALLGRSLAEVLEASLVPEPWTLAMAREVAAGLVAAHTAGIVHRDLKPGNLFIVSDPESHVRAKVIDFGFAKDTRDPDAGPSSSNLVLGTAQYMAPEQVLADPVDGRTDIYGFGMVLFRTLTGHLPFDLDAGVDLFSHQLFSPTPPPSWLVDNMDDDLEQIVLRCVRKHPENRYPSMQAVLDDLECVANGREISDLPITRDPDVYKPKRDDGHAAAASLARYFGTDAPPPATSRFDPDSVKFRR